MEAKYGHINMGGIEENRKYLEMKKIKKQEEIERILNRSKSVSIYELFQIRNVSRIMACAIMMAINDYITKVVHKNVFRHPEDSIHWVNNITNANFLIGIIMLCLSFLGNTNFFSGRRMTLLLFSIIILTCWNVIWISFSDINEIES